MNIYVPRELDVAQVSSTPVIVNVFNGSKHSKVRFRLLPDGPWVPMEHFEAWIPSMQN